MPETPSPATLAPATLARPIAFIDLAAQRQALGPGLEAAIGKVLAHGAYIMGPEVAELEAELAAFCGVRHAIACANGTDALVLPLMARRIGPGDAVFCPSFTFAATAEAVALVGATPLFVDVLPETFNLDPQSLVQGIGKVRAQGLVPRAVIAVDLFGQPADYDAIEPVCEKNGLWLLVDSAQGFGSTYRARRSGSIGTVATTSFFPAKPLGCYGDGGAMFTNDDELVEALRSLRLHGQGSEKYDNVRIGLNSRLDTIQAAILLEKLKLFPGELEARNAVAARYGEGLGDLARDLVTVPAVIEGATSSWAQYTVRVEAKRRDKLIAALKAQGIPSAVYYPRPLHLQTAYRDYPLVGNGLPASEKLAAEVLSLPMHPYLDRETQDYIIAGFRAALRG